MIHHTMIFNKPKRYKAWYKAAARCEEWALKHFSSTPEKRAYDRYTNGSGKLELRVDYYGSVSMLRALKELYRDYPWGAIPWGSPWRIVTSKRKRSKHRQETRLDRLKQKSP